MATVTRNLKKWAAKGLTTVRKLNKKTAFNQYATQLRSSNFLACL